MINEVNHTPCNLSLTGKLRPQGPAAAQEAPIKLFFCYNKHAG